VTAANFDIELQLLIDAIFLKYHYDFREYALASLKRRLRGDDARLRTLSQLRTGSCTSPPATFRSCSTTSHPVPVSEMFRDPA
jgi:chemotaxis protein methyltransferase CheR